MKRAALIYSLIFSAFANLFAQQTDFPKLTGPYLGHKPPGKTPEPFAPGIFDYRYASYHTSINVSPDGQEIYWSEDNTYRRANPNDPVIKGIRVSKIKNGHWTTPKFAFSPGPSDDAPVISLDGKKLYFVTTRPIDQQRKKGKETIWVAERTAEGWSEPIPLPAAINSVDGIHWGISVDNQGSIYFGATAGIYRSKVENGVYQKSEKLDLVTNKPGSHDFCPFISPDGSYLIFTRWENNTRRLFISFRNKDDSWSSPKAINSAVEMNEEHGQIAPYVCPDGKYLFFLDEVGDGIKTKLNSRHYWVDAGFIDKLRPKEAR